MLIQIERSKPVTTSFFYVHCSVVLQGNYPMFFYNIYLSIILILFYRQGRKCTCVMNRLCPAKIEPTPSHTQEEINKTTGPKYF